MKVYLAGGMRSGWQDEVIKRLQGPTFLDPRSHGFTDEAAYTEWDLRAIRQSDFVFAYLEADNPSGMNLAMEIGYAVALGKPVVFVDEKAANDERHHRYTAMLRQRVEAYSHDFESGLLSLAHLSGLA